MTGFSKKTITKLVVDLGAACSRYQDEYIRRLRSRRIQCDEIWSFVGAKEKNVSTEKKAEGWGDCWTWTALDADSKLIVSFRLGSRDAGTAHEFMTDVASRLSSRVQLTTDGHKSYLNAVEDAFGGAVDYAVLVKISPMRSIENLMLCNVLFGPIDVNPLIDRGRITDAAAPMMDRLTGNETNRCRSRSSKVGAVHVASQDRQDLGGNRA